jgi:crotonobetainyl-CoA:carnitine CoA-transferase CaiB-like acyl-CoA transferase
LAYWQACFAELDLCVEAVLTLDEALNSNLAKERNWVAQVPFAEGSRETEAQLALPIKFSRSQAVYHYVGQALGEGDWPN